MSNPLATVSLVPSPQMQDDVTTEFEKKHTVPSSISSLLNNTKSSDGTNVRVTSMPSSPKLMVTSPPPANCGAPELHHDQQQYQRKRPCSAIENGEELSIMTTDQSRPQSLLHYSLDTPHLAQQPSAGSPGNQQQQQHYHHHLPTPVSPAAPMPQHKPQCAEVGPPQQLKEEPNENDDHDIPNNHHHHHHPISSRPRPNIPAGMYTSFSVKQSFTTNTSSRNSGTRGLSPSASSPLKSRSPRDSMPTTPKPYTCIECDQTFRRAHNLKSHTATHSLERPYKCESCQAKFRRLHDLKRHQKLHTGERPHICNMCQRSFSRLDALNRHQRTEGGSACHYRQNRHRTDQKRSDSFEEGSLSPSLVDALIPVDRRHASLPQLPPTSPASSPTSAVVSSSSSFPSVSAPTPTPTPTTPLPPPIQTPTPPTQQQPQRPSPSRPTIPQLNLRHCFTSPHHPDDASQSPQTLVFQPASTNTLSSAVIGGSSPHETTRRIVLPPPSNSTPTLSTSTQLMPTSLNTFPLHPPPPQHPPAASPSSASRSSYLQLHDPQLISVERRPRMRSSEGCSEHTMADGILSPGAYSGPKSYPALRTAYMQLLEQYRGLNDKCDAKTEEVETLRDKIHDLQVENRVLRSLVFERQQ